MIQTRMQRFRCKACRANISHGEQRQPALNHSRDAHMRDGANAAAKNDRSNNLMSDITAARYSSAKEQAGQHELCRPCASAETSLWPPLMHRCTAAHKMLANMRSRTHRRRRDADKYSLSAIIAPPSERFIASYILLQFYDLYTRIRFTRNQYLACWALKVINAPGKKAVFPFDCKLS